MESPSRSRSLSPCSSSRGSSRRANMANTSGHPSSLNPQPSTLNPQPWYLKHKPQTTNHRPQRSRHQTPSAELSCPAESVFHLYDSDDFRPQHLLRERLFVGHIRSLPPISGCLDVTMVVKNDFSHFPPVPPGGAFRLFLETELPSVCDDHPSADKDERLEIIKQRYNHVRI